MFYIPPRDRPVDAVKVTDPVTGATYMRPRPPKKKEEPDPFPQGTPKPSSCRTLFCKKAGQKHDECEPHNPFDPYYAYPAFYRPVVQGYPHFFTTNPRDPFDPYYARPAHHVPAPRRHPPAGGNPQDPFDPYYARPPPVIPPRPSRRPYPFFPPPPSPSSGDSDPIPSPFIPRRPPPSPDPNPNPVIPRRPARPQENAAQRAAEEIGFRRWLESFPHNGIPREMPAGWNYNLYREGRYTPYRSGNDLPVCPPIGTPWRPPPAPTPPTPPTAATPWPNIAGWPNRVPDRVEWNNVQGGRLQWTPHPWVPHPLPHPDVPARTFWGDQGGDPGAMYPWRGPGGWSPYYGLDQQRAHLITGGHPLPGMDPFWTPTRWVPPLYSPQYGVTLSPWLSANPRNPYVPHVLWDAAVEPPYLIRRLTSRGNIVDFANTEFFNQQATYPPVRNLQINLPNMRNSWGPVVINKDTNMTVGDIFNAVWNYLHKQITPADWSALKSTYGEPRTSRIVYAYHRRCTTAGGLYEYVRSQGIKRIDLLEGNTVYWGTYLTYNVDGTWSLTMAFLPRAQPANFTF